MISAPNGDRIRDFLPVQLSQQMCKLISVCLAFRWKLYDIYIFRERVYIERDRERYANVAVTFKDPVSTF